MHVETGAEDWRYTDVMHTHTQEALIRPSAERVFGGQIGQVQKAPREAELPAWNGVVPSVLCLPNCRVP